jgi:hypothetical protein
MLLKLLSLTLVWPSVANFKAWGPKSAYIYPLDRIARKTTHTLQLSTRIFSEKITLKIKPEVRLVLKRENSNCSRHSHILPAATSARKSIAILRNIKKSSELWLVQDYVPELRALKEFQFFIIDGKLCYGIITMPDNEKVQVYLTNSVPDLKQGW